MTDKQIYKDMPKLRFPEFQASWEVKRLGDIFVRVREKNVENNKNVLTISAQFGLVNQFEYFNKNVAAADVTNYFLIKKGDFAYNKSRSQGYPFGAIKPLVLYDKGVVSTLYICFRLKDESEYDATFFQYYFETGIINSQISDIAQEGARNHGLLNISAEDFFNILLFVPPLAEQQKIAQSMLELDKLIKTNSEKLELLKAHKKGLMQQLLAFTNSGGNLLNINDLQTTRLRFPGFKNTKGWEIKKLGECFTERIDRNHTDLPLLSLTESDGIVLQEDTNRKNNSNADKSKYLRVRIGDIAYNTMRMWQGRCALVTIEGIVSPAYTVCSPKEGINSRFFYYLFKTNEMINSFHRNSQGLVNDTLNLKYESFKEIKVNVPSLSEQKQIAQCLLTTDDLISHQNSKITSLQLHKRGLMQQLFPQA